jgi:hypothetical protein
MRLQNRILILLKWIVLSKPAQCIERQLAINAEDNFNDIFIIALDRDMQVWPNGELEDINEALALRKDADFDFGDGYFGNAEKLYLDAIEVINKALNAG